jgi:hypothetical protein
VEKKVYVEELVLVGTTGFSIIDSTNWIYDSTKLDIREYFEYKKDSLVRIARKLLKQETKYYSFIESDTLGLDRIINSVLLPNKYKTDYNFKKLVLYHGLHYILYYKTTDQKEYFISYVPELLPDSLRVLHNFMKRIVVSDNSGISTKFEYSGITVKIANELYKNRNREYPPPPPPPQSLQKRKTTATKNIESIKK